MNAASFFRWGSCLGSALLGLSSAQAWDYEGHRWINLLALDSLPTNMPAFLRVEMARERVAFLAGEPDRWRNTPELSLKHSNGPDHYLDLDLLPALQLQVSQLSPFRYEFDLQADQARRAHPAEFPPPDPARDPDHSKALIGFLPWTITEYQARLKSAFSYLKEYEAAGTPEEIANAQANVLYVMGVMGHFVGDGSQPLHTTRHHHGWLGENPNHYTTNYTFHAWIDGGYLQQFPPDLARLRSRLRPARLLPADGRPPKPDTFALTLKYLQDQHAQVETLFQLDRAGKLSGRREIAPEGHEFLTGQLLVAAQMLGDLWLTAWQQAPPDMYLRAALDKRRGAR
jgi:hypothetical protein